MSEFSVLVGGIAGDGINEAGMTVCRLFSRMGYNVYMYYDYPSLIRGGHNFALIRASHHNIGAHKDKIDFLFALNQETWDLHKGRLKNSSFVIYDRDKVKTEGLLHTGCGVPISRILKEEDAPLIMRNNCLIGAFCRIAGVEWDFLDEILRRHFTKAIGVNLKVAKRGFDSAEEYLKIERLSRPASPILTGNQAIGLGLIKAGLGAYVAYPMTPSSGLLDFMAHNASEFGLKVVHPESEIAVVLTALGFAYQGIKVAVGTSGGGFCLMTEGLSLSGMAEMPVVIMLGQRTGPSTGLPTYTAQGDLNFALYAGHGEFPRLVVSPGDAEEAYYWSGVALNMAWKYQIPSIILSDKIVCEGSYTFDIRSEDESKEEQPFLWDGKGDFRRYRFTESGVSWLAFPPATGQTIKMDSYAHDEMGITTEDAAQTSKMNEKRLLKGRSLAAEMERYKTIKTIGHGEVALLTWGSNKGVCAEVAEKLGLRTIQVLVLSPFPMRLLNEAISGVDKIISVECNSTGQLAGLARCHGIQVKEQILKYDGRPFSVENLEAELEKVLA